MKDLRQRVVTKVDLRWRVELKTDDHMETKQHLVPDPCHILLWPQIRQALPQVLFPSKAFSWPRHVTIA